MKLLYGTTNPGKLQHMREMIKGLGIEIIGLDEVGLSHTDIDENGNNPLENARIKAIAYYKAAKIPVFSCDSGLYVEGLSPDKQPGVHVRRVDGRELSDDEMIKYYSDLALRLGGEVKARYRNAICLVVDEETIYEYDGGDIAESFLITSKSHPKRIPGFPLDSLSLNIKTGKYYLDCAEEIDESQDHLDVGFRNFFTKTIIG